MNFKKILVAALISSSALTAFADSEVSNNQFYVQLNGGIAKGLKPKGDFKNSSLGKSAIFGIESGYKFDENFRASLSFDYINNLKNSYSVTTFDGAPYTINNYSFKTKSYVVMANAYYDIIEYSGFTPYVTAGVGIAKNKTKGTDTLNDYSANGTLTKGPLTSSPTGSKTNFAYKIGLGTRFAVSNEIDLDLRYQFADLGKIKAKDSKQTLNGKLRTHQLMIGIAYKF